MVPIYSSSSGWFQITTKILYMITGIDHSERGYFLDVHCQLCRKKFSIAHRSVHLDCGLDHIFHYTCLNSYLKENDNCPLCESEINELLVKAAKSDEDMRDFESFNDRHMGYDHGVINPKM